MNDKYYTTNNDDSRWENRGRALIPPGKTEDEAIMWCGEPEDFSFYRDLGPVLDELNKLVDRIEHLEEENYNLSLDRRELTETEREWL